MKAIIEFSLPEDQTEYQLVNDASKMFSVLWEMKQWLRGQVKYAPDEMSQEAYDAFEQCRNKLNELLMNDNLDLDI
jgi:hypothetical protein